MPDSNGNEKLAAALTDISERVSALVRDEIELAKAEMTEKVKGVAAGAAAIAAGAVFGIFAVVFFLLTIAWVVDGIFIDGAGDLWLGFLVTFLVLLALSAGAALFAWRKLRVGAPTPTMAIDEARKIRATVTARSGRKG